MSWLVRTLGRPLATRGERQPADAAVVLGASLRADGTLTEILEERVQAGVALLQEGLACRLCMSGGVPPRARSRRPEAEAMAVRARELGVSADALVAESASTNTRENALFSARLLLPDHRRVWVVTQPFHLRRALFWFRRAGFEPLGWHIDDSVQYRYPRRGLRWVFREYGAWVRLGALEVWYRSRGR